MRHELESRREEASRALEDTLSLETGPPFMTLNDHYYESTRQKWLIRYSYVRRRAWFYRLPGTPQSEDEGSGPSAASYTHRPHRPPEESAESRALRALSELGYENLSLEDLSRLHPPDRFGEEITVMADVRAYWQVAYKVGASFTPLVTWTAHELHCHCSASSIMFRSRSNAPLTRPSPAAFSSACGQHSTSVAPT
jgi:hypothetical protein